MTALLRLEGAAFGYRRRRVLTDVDLEVRPGDLIGVVGGNGSGKSTLLRGMLGLVRPMAGRVTRAARAVGYVPQREGLDALYPLTTLEVVRMGAYGRLRGLRRLGREDRALAERCLDRVVLGPRAREPFASLSGGQRQRALVARALMVRPDLMLLDEPTSGVDVPAAEHILDLLTELARDDGLAVVLVSHQVDLLRCRVDRAAWVGGGRVTVGPAAELLAPGRLAAFVASGGRGGA